MDRVASNVVPLLGQDAEYELAIRAPTFDELGQWISPRAEPLPDGPAVANVLVEHYCRYWLVRPLTEQRGAVEGLDRRAHFVKIEPTRQGDLREGLAAIQKWEHSPEFLGVLPGHLVDLAL